MDKKRRKFSDPILPLPNAFYEIIDLLQFVLYLFFGFCFMVCWMISIGYVLSQGKYLLRNENKGKETIKDYIEIWILYLLMYKGLTKVVEFFERQIKKLFIRKDDKGVNC